jgi:hypothetical protein
MKAKKFLEKLAVMPRHSAAIEGMLQSQDEKIQQAFNKNDGLALRKEIARHNKFPDDTQVIHFADDTTVIHI